MGQGADGDGEILVRRQITQGHEVRAGRQIEACNDGGVLRDDAKMVGAVRGDGDAVGRQVQDRGQLAPGEFGDGRQPRPAREHLVQGAVEGGVACSEMLRMTKDGGVVDDDDMATMQHRTRTP